MPRITKELVMAEELVTKMGELSIPHARATAARYESDRCIPAVRRWREVAAWCEAMQTPKAAVSATPSRIVAAEERRAA